MRALPDISLTLWTCGTNPGPGIVPQIAIMRWEKPLETHCADRTRATCIDTGNDCRFRQAGVRAACRARRYSDRGQRRIWTWPRPYAPRRPRSPLWMGTRPRAPLRLAPLSSPLIKLVSCGRLLSSSHCPNKSGHLQSTVAPIGATSSVFRSVEVCQPRPISTAIRIRSEWFFAPSFCLSKEVVLATVL